ncbi:unnamed protein product [Cylicocyclus nassatus]|uniref:Uncharacterized protein n=1 Tax=Cylicocyclus nassatus TaxID=53992 RepID=A0AA36H6U6_CYLNA|nr:unnamed protein product [Cylicocyclus nassatus]
MLYSPASFARSIALLPGMGKVLSMIAQKTMFISWSSNHMGHNDKPKKMQSADIDYRHTKQGALVMQTEYKGDVKHELDEEQSEAISHVAFDPSQNSIAYIGTQVEQLVGGSQMTLPKSLEEVAAQASKDKTTTSVQVTDASSDTVKGHSSDTSRSREEMKGPSASAEMLMAERNR